MNCSKYEYIHDKVIRVSASNFKKIESIYLSIHLKINSSHDIFRNINMLHHELFKFTRSHNKYATIGDLIFVV